MLISLHLLHQEQRLKFSLYRNGDVAISNPKVFLVFQLSHVIVFSHFLQLQNDKKHYFLLDLNKEIIAILMGKQGTNS